MSAPPTPQTAGAGNSSCCATAVTITASASAERWITAVAWGSPAVASLIQASGGSLADWLDGSFRPYPQKLVNVTVPDRSRRTGWQACEPLASAVAAAEVAMAGSGRVLVRASGTEPLLRVMVEAAEQGDVDHWSSHLAELADQHLNAA